MIRRGHVNHNGWADIGYHFAVDRAGRVWSCRPLVWQGAHVKDRNEGNIGVLVLGNFEIERPTSAQLNALAIHLKTLATRLSHSETQGLHAPRVARGRHRLSWSEPPAGGESNSRSWPRA